MKNVKLIPVAVVSVALAGGAAAVVQAQTATDAPVLENGSVELVQERGAERNRERVREGRGERGGERFRRGGRGGFGGEMMRDLFDTVDANGDRTVTLDEIAAYQTATLNSIDVSGDGALSIEEFDTLFRELTRSRMVDAFQALDSDGDGLIGAEEIDTRIARFVERMDRDGDGALTLQRRGDRGGDDE